MAKRLKTAFDCRRYLANLVNRTDSGEVDPAVAGRIGFLINILLKSIAASSLEDRVKKLELKMER